MKMMGTAIRLVIAAALLTPFVATSISNDVDDLEAIAGAVNSCTSGDVIDHNEGRYRPDQGTFVLMTEYNSGVILAATLQLSNVTSVKYDGVAVIIECDPGNACIRVTNAQRRDNGRIHIDSQKKQDSFKFLGCDDRGSRRIEQLFNQK